MALTYRRNMEAAFSAVFVLFFFVSTGKKYVMTDFRSSRYEIPPSLEFDMTVSYRIPRVWR